MKKFVLLSAFLGFISLTSVAHAMPTFQYADNVIGFSSQFSTSNWSAAQALGAPDTFFYGDIITSWAPGSKHGSS